MRFRVFSTFSGIGGFEIGIQNAWRNCSSVQTSKEVRFNGAGIRSEGNIGMPVSVDVYWRWLRPTCVGYSEIDKYAIKVYEKQFPGVKNYGDITRINAKELPDFDCLVGGFPCQAFSIAGKRRGFDDTRGTLFFDLARILREKQPRYFVFENVKGLLSHDQGNTFRTIITTIDELGYDCQWSVLNSKNFGVPQNRERVYIVGHLRGTPRPQIFPIAGANGEDIIVSGILNTETWRKRHEQIRRVHSGAGVSPTIPTAQGGGVMIKVDTPSIRRLTPLECERLQGFPDGWTAEGVDGAISDSQRYKMCGNAVTTNVVQAVFERIFDGKDI